MVLLGMGALCGAARDGSTVVLLGMGALCGAGCVVLTVFHYSAA